MNLSQFLHFNSECPVCTKPLTLYMHINKSSLWRAKEVEPGTYQFHQHLLKNEKWSENHYMTLYDLGDTFTTEFSSSKLGLNSKTWQLFFFKICGNDCFIDNKFDYDLNWYDVCYHRSSVFYEFRNHPSDKKKWQLEVMQEDQKDLINRDESFIFKNVNGDKIEKVYALSLDYENKHTKLWYYSVTEEQSKMDDFEPNIFEKEDLPLLRVRPDFSLENRDKLISKFDGWILMS